VEHLIWEEDPPELRSPVLVCSFRGWNDAAGAASAALETIAGTMESELLAELDPEEFFDFQANRPTITLTDGMTRHIEWPSNQLVGVRAPSAERDLLLLDGTEPNLRWRTFANSFADAAERMGVEMVVTLGALIAEVAHTMPVPITGLASDEELVERLDLQRSSYEGPTGVVGVIHAAAPARGAHRRRRRRIRARGGDPDLRGAGRPRGRRQSGDRGAGRAHRGRAGRAVHDARGGPVGGCSRT
jgi:proteasome assembly chaperone (PAC2) family protein